MFAKFDRKKQYISPTPQLPEKAYNPHDQLPWSLKAQTTLSCLR